MRSFSIKRKRLFIIRKVDFFLEGMIRKLQKYLRPLNLNLLIKSKIMGFQMAKNDLRSFLETKN